MSSTSTGEHLRDAGCQLAESSNKSKSLALRIAILELALEGNPFTADELPGDDDVLRDNKTGAAFLALSKQRLIAFTGQCYRSKRPFRHAGLMREWLVTSAIRAQQELALLRMELTAQVDSELPLFPPGGGKTDDVEIGGAV